NGATSSGIGGGVTGALIRALIKKGAPLQGGKQNNKRTASSVQFVICHDAGAKDPKDPSKHVRADIVRIWIGTAGARSCSTLAAPVARPLLWSRSGAGAQLSAGEKGPARV